ncbi:UNVERIFIED_CONTAM: hypothetical protein K2H54_020802 [Gekko kuhli]
MVLLWLLFPRFFSHSNGFGWLQIQSQSQRSAGSTGKPNVWCPFHECVVGKKNVFLNFFPNPSRIFAVETESVRDLNYYTATGDPDLSAWKTPCIIAPCIWSSPALPQALLFHRTDSVSTVGSSKQFIRCTFPTLLNLFPRLLVALSVTSP